MLRFSLSRPHSPLPSFVSVLSFASFGRHLLNPKVPLFSKGCSLDPPLWWDSTGSTPRTASASVCLWGRSLLPSRTVSAYTVSSEPGTCPRCSAPENLGQRQQPSSPGCPDGLRAARCQCWPGDQPGWGRSCPRVPSLPPGIPGSPATAAPPAEPRREATREAGPGAPAGLAHGPGELETGSISSSISPQAAALPKPRTPSSLGWVSPVQLGYEGKRMSALVWDITGVIFWANVWFPPLFITHTLIVFPWYFPEESK